MSARARERDAWDEDTEGSEGASNSDVEDEVSEDEPGFVSGAAASTQPTESGMQQRMAEVEATTQLGDTKPPQKLGHWGRKKKNRQWRNNRKATDMETFAKATPMFSQATTFDMEETANPSHMEVDTDDHSHDRKMLDLKTMGNHIDFLSRIKDSPDIKHTFTDKHRKIVMAYAVLMIAAALYGLVVGVQVYNCGEHTTVSSSYIVVCVYMLIICPFGLYGAARVTSDVEAEIGSMEAVQAAKDNQDLDSEQQPSEEIVAKGEEDDGLGTVGQSLIANFFVASMFGVMLWLIFAVEAFQLADQAMLHDCSHQDSLMATLGWLGVVGTLLVCAGSYFVGKVVSGYYLTRTIVVILNFVLMCLGAIMYLLAASVVSQIICLSDGYVGYNRLSHPEDEKSKHSGLQESMGTLVVFGLIALSGYSLCMVSALGHFAASRLSRRLLGRHAKVLSRWLGLSFVFTCGALIVGAETFVSAHCEDILTGLPMSWFQTELQCPKYIGAGETWNGTGWMSTDIGPSEIPLCVKRFNRFAWEVNPVQRAGGGEVNHYGCINKLCCRRLIQRVKSWEWSIILTFSFIFMWAFLTIWMVRRLKLGTQLDSQSSSRLKRRESKMMWAARICLAVLALLVPMVLFDNTCSATSADGIGVGNFQPDVSSNLDLGSLPPSCYNNVLDGLETDVDCGGLCSTKCVVDEACDETSDCATPMVCLPTEPFDPGSGCFDERCLYRQNDRASGLCGFPGPGITCFDGLMGQRETCVDGGGPQCRQLGRRCQSECVVDDDCQQNMAQLRCEQYRCVTCAGGTKDGGETDIDCGGPTCPPCGDGDRCLTHNDCRSELCYSSTGRCVSYNNNIKDGSETGIDCGGTAPRRCQLGTECEEDSDCESGNCVQSSCAEADPAEQCWSGAQDGLETCVDAGGPTCRSFGLACDEGEGCHESIDCKTGLHCYEGVCFSCSNGVVDGDESDIDCGSTCGACADGRACTTDNHCLHNSYCFFPASDASGMCASAYNNRRDADESCVDGGGQAAFLFNRVCPIDATCNADSDCITGNCGDQGICIADDVRIACLDGVQNGWETDVDCGGRSCRSVGQLCDIQTSVECTSNVDCLTACHGMACPCINGRCGSPQQCLSNEDCVSSICSHGYCRSCANQLFDGRETDVDCGGNCEGCELGRVCHVGSDCASGMCEFDHSLALAWKVCVSCFNGVQDGSEIGVDCGGSCVRRCPIGSLCIESDDCATGVCNIDIHMCVAASNIPGSCSNGQRDSDEADVDCGGACRQSNFLCSSGSICQSNDDCDSYQCSALHRCVDCNDGVLNGAETDVDCGGPICQGCADSQRCDQDSDCNSQSCGGGGLGHRACSSCLNGIVDGLEADVDCGAVCPAQCLEGRRCHTDDDCISMHCNDDSICTRVDPSVTCADGLRGEHETCIDGGGPQCNAAGLHCTLTESCNVDDDCYSGYCADGVCVSCVDGQRNGDETDTDCGGSRCEQCPDGSSCMIPSDCIHQACWWRNAASTYGICYSHSNGIRDGDETCPDGGGPSSGTACENGEACSVDSDCISTNCAPTCIESASESIVADFDACAAVTELDNSTACEAVMGSISITIAVCTYSGIYNKACQVQRPEITCYNNVQDELETDVDCGGDMCRARTSGTCSPGQVCIVDADCEFGSICSSAEGSGPQVCILHGCTNGVKSGDESDVDCGGACDSCLPGSVCNTDADCFSSHACLAVSTNGTARCAQALPIVFSPVRCGETALGATGVCPANPAMECGETCGPDRTCPVGCADAPIGSLTTFEISTGDVLMHTILVESSEPYGIEGLGLSCIIAVKLFITAGLTISFPAERSMSNDLGFDVTCREQTSVVADARNDVTLTGPVRCVAALLDAYRLDTTCSTLWSHDDSVDAVLTANLLDTNPFCTMPSTREVNFAFRIVGRPQLGHRGTLVAAASSAAGRPSPCAIGGIHLSGEDRACAQYVESLTNCERGCCDEFPAVNHLDTSWTCSQLLNLGFGCDYSGLLGLQMITTSELCPDTCGLFMLDVPFTATSHAANSAGTMTVYINDGTRYQMITSGFIATTLTTPMRDGMVQVGTIPMASYGSRRGPIEGRCVSASVWGGANALQGEGLTVARLRNGHLIYPANTGVIAQVDVDLGGGGAFTFEDQAAGTYTIECVGLDSSGLTVRRGPERLVVVEGDVPLELPQVVLMPGTPQDSPSAITIVVSWDEYGYAAGSKVDAHVTFAATEDGSLCHVFYGAEECGGTTYLLDGPTEPGTAWFSSAWGTDGLRADVVQIRSVISTMYSVYARLDSTSGGIVSVRAEAFSGGNKVGQSLGTFQVPTGGGSAYMALMCIDARVGAPFVVAEPVVTMRPPAMCT